MDPKEYGRFRTTLGLPDPGVVSRKSVQAPDFGSFVTKKVNEFINQEESNSMKQFGEKLKAKLEQLDQDVVKLKAPALTNQTEYD
jgi:hypothetical protein